MNRIDTPELARDLLEPARLAAFEARGHALVGDVAFPAVREVASALTPVPGGVGPLTIALLMKNTVQGGRRSSPSVLRVGLTGGIACGKSVVRDRLAAAGLPTLDLDRVAHEVMAPGAARVRGGGGGVRRGDPRPGGRHRPPGPGGDRLRGSRRPGPPGRHRPPAGARGRGALGGRPGPPGELRARDRRGASRRVGDPSALRPPGRGRLSARAAGRSLARARRPRRGGGPSPPGRADAHRHEAALRSRGDRHLGEPGGEPRGRGSTRSPPGRAWRPRRVRPRSRCRGGGPCARSRLRLLPAPGAGPMPAVARVLAERGGPDLTALRAHLRPGATGPWWYAAPDERLDPSDLRPIRRRPSGRPPS